MPSVTTYSAQQWCQVNLQKQACLKNKLKIGNRLFNQKKQGRKIEQTQKNSTKIRKQKQGDKFHKQAQN